MRALHMNEIETIRPLVTKFEVLVKDNIQSSKTFFEIVRHWLQTGQVKIGLTMNDDGTPVGLAAIDLKKNRILVIFVNDLDGNLETSEMHRHESELIDWCFQELEKPPARIEFPRLTTNLKELLLNRGYMEIRRARMMAKREVAMGREQVEIPEGFVVEPYRSENKESVAEVIAKANENSIDLIIYPEFFGSKDAAMYFLERLEESAFGEFRKGYSKVLIANENIVGCCMISFTEDIAMIPEIGVLPEYQGKGLGKALIMKTIQDILEKETSLTELGLAVTLCNPAKHLYEKIGFTICDEFSAIVYNGKK